MREQALINTLNKNLNINIIDCIFLFGEVLLQLETKEEADKLFSAVLQAEKKAQIEKEGNYYFVCMND
jgi:hypothetical protein